MKNWFPTLMNWVASAGEKLHRQLTDEIRTVVKAEGDITFASLEKNEVNQVNSLRGLSDGTTGSVPIRGKAREDMVIRSHEARFEIKKGEMIFGYMPFATNDPKIFDDADKFVADRFVGEKGIKLLKYVLWSNGPDTEDPKAENKQCPGKDLVVLLSSVFLAELFLHYDTFTVEARRLLLGTSVKVKTFTKAVV